MGLGQQGGGADRRGGGRRSALRAKKSFGRSRDKDKDKDGATDPDAENMDEIIAKVEAHTAPPPRQWIDHTPEDLTLDDLRVDWPSIPTDKIGMIESISSKLRWAAGKMQHDYDTPADLAHRLRRGDLVHFESEAEKAEVLAIVRKDSPFWPVGTSERQILADKLIRGIYIDSKATKQIHHARSSDSTKSPSTTATSTAATNLISSVVQNLDNNGTYQARETDQLVRTIQKVISS